MMRRYPLLVLSREARFSRFGGRQIELKVAVNTFYGRGIGVVWRRMKFLATAASHQAHAHAFRSRSYSRVN